MRRGVRRPRLWGTDEGMLITTEGVGSKGPGSEDQTYAENMAEKETIKKMMMCDETEPDRRDAIDE